MSKDYNPSQIRRFLEDYETLADYRMPTKPLKEDSSYTEYAGPNIQKKVNEHAYYELPAMTKSDIQYAIQHLPRMEKLVIFGEYFRNPILTFDDFLFCLRMSHKEFIRLSGLAIKGMTKILNGQVERG